MGHNFAASINPFFTSCNTNRIRIRIIRIRIKHLFKRRFSQVNNNISYKAIYRHAIYK